MLARRRCTQLTTRVFVKHKVASIHESFFVVTISNAQQNEKVATEILSLTYRNLTPCLCVRRLPQVVMCTAQNLLQRFFYRKSLTKFDAFSVAMACMLLAMKIEEDPRQPRAVVLVFHRMFERRMGVEPSAVIPPTSFRVLRDEMLRVELHVLKELGFGFYNIMDHPHKFILYYLRVLELDIEGDVSQRAWNYVNDSLRTDLSLRFRSEVIACAAIYMASRSLGIKLPDNPPWWILFNADMREMGEICNAILALYHRPKVTFLEPLCERSVFRRGGPLREDTAVEDVREIYTPVVEAVEASSTAAAAMAEEPAVLARTDNGPSTQDPPDAVAVVAPVDDCGTAGSPVAPISSAAGSAEAQVTEGNGTETVSIDKGPGSESRSESKSRSRSRSKSKSHRSHSTSRSAPIVEREDGVDRELNGRSERVQDRERDRKRQREYRRSRSRSRERDTRRRESSRERDSDRERTRDRDRDRGRGRDWGRDRDRERDRRHDRGEHSRRSRR